MNIFLFGKYIVKYIALCGLLLFIGISSLYSQTSTGTVNGGAAVVCPASPVSAWSWVPAVAGVSISDWSRGAGVTCASANNAINGSGFNTASDAASLTANAYYSITITAAATHNVTLNSIFWNTTVSGASACNFNIYYSNNGGPSTAFGTTGSITTGNTFTGAVTVAAGTSLVLYFIPSGTAAAGTTVRLQNGSTINLTSTPINSAIVNDDPCTATPITVGSGCTFQAGTNTGATATSTAIAANPTCSSYSGGDVWYTATVPPSGVMTFDTQAGTITDGGMAIYTGPCGGLLTQVACDDDGGTGLMPQISSLNLTPGTTIYIRFWGYAGATGTFGLCATELIPPAAPVNDNPCTASPITVGTGCTYLSTTNVNATTTSSAIATNPTCSSYSGGDVWYSVVVPATGILTFDTQAGTMTDGGMAVYTGPCAGLLTEVACDDDGGAGLMPQIASLNLTPGISVYIRVWGYAGATGTFGLCVTQVMPPPPLTNNEPCFAIALPAVSSTCNYVTGTTVGATVSNTAGIPNPSCVGNPRPDVWYSVIVPPSGILNVATQAGTMTDGVMALYTGTCAGNLTEIACNDNGIGMPTILQSNLTPGTTIYIRIWGFTNADAGTFGICATSPTPTVQDCPAAIPICQGVYSQSVSYTGTGNLPNEINSINSCLSSGERADVWYTFTVQNSGDLSFTLTPNNATEDYDWAVYNLTNANCADIYSNPALSVSCNFSADGGATGPNGGTTLTSQGAAGTPFNATIPVVAGQTYVINVSNYSTSLNGYTLDLTNSTASIFDNTPPRIQSVNSFNGCAGNQIVVNFSENILCNTIDPNDFTITGPGGPYLVTSVVSNDCASGATYTNSVTLTVSPQLSIGSYQVCMDNTSVSDLCGNIATIGTVSCANFTITTPPITPVFTPVGPICSGTLLPALPTISNNGIIGSWTPAINNTATTTYTFTPIEGQCALPTILTIVVNSATIPTFPAIGPLCSGATAPVLPTTSNNGIIGVWSPATISNTSSGTYTFTPNAAAGSCSQPLTITVTVYDPLVIYAHGNDPTCVTVCDGSATVDVVGGASPYTYLWSNGASTQTISNLCVGTYSVTVTDSNGCISSNFAPVTNNCIQIQSILVDACSGTEQDEEMVFFQTGQSAVTTSALTATWPTTADSWLGLCQNPSFITNINATITGGGMLIPVPAGGTIPANANVVLITSNAAANSSMSFANLTGPLYVLFQCSGNTQGHFGNASSAAGIKTLILNFGNGCTDTVSYNNTLLINQNGSTGGNATINNGASVNYSSNGTATYINHGCTIPYSIQGSQVVLTAPPTSTSTTNVIRCTNQLPYNWNGTNYNAAGTYTFSTTNTAGCDSFAIINLTVNSIYTVNQTASTCQAVPYTLPWGGTASVNGVYTHTYSSVSNCDSVVNITLTVKPTYTVNLTASTCQGVPYTLPWGGTASVNGVYTHTYSSVSNCDSVVNITLTVKPTYTVNLTASTCQGVPYTLPWGGTASVNGVYTHTYSSVSNCDSVVNITLTVKPTYTVNLTASTCQGVPYTLPWGGTASTAGSYSHTYTTISGCDSVVNIALTVNPTYTVNQTATTCQGVAYSLPWGGSASSAGTYSHTYTTISGCDSVVNIALTVNPTYTVNQTATTCQGVAYSLPWGGTASTAGTYSHTYTTISGCDSIVNIALTVNPTYTVNQTATTCQGVAYSLPWGGTASTAGTYTHTYTTISGCDSVVNITLSIDATFTTNLTAAICQGQSYNLPWGGTASTAGTYSHIYTTISGCDSVVNIALTVNPTYTVNQTATTCQGVAYSLPWGGTASTAGTYSHTYTTISGCDSVVNITLSIDATFTTNLTAAICQGQSYNLPWGGSASTAGIYSHIYTTISGCDSVVNIALTVNPTYTVNQTATTCQGVAYSLPWGGSASTAGIYSHTYTTISGCDSIVNIALTVNPTYTVNQTASTCQGVPYTLPWGGTASTAGTYSHTYTTISGCDSVVNITLSIDATFTTNLTAAICQGQSYNLPWGGSASTAGIYSHIYTTISGCDSVVNIALTVNPTYTVNQTATTCQGVAYSLPWGGSASTAGIYSHTYTTISGCDSIVNIALTVNPTYTVNQTASTCQGVPYTLPWGGTASTAGTYSHTYTTISGCDSVVNITLSIDATFTTNLTSAICQGQSYNLPWGGSASTAGTYSHTYTTISGCDSVVNITLSIDATFTINLTAAICQGQSYNLPWGGSASTAGTYTHTYTTISGCDSVVNITLSIDATFTTNLTAAICQGQSYNLPWGGSASTAGTYSHTYTTISGCDSVVNIALTVNPIYTVNQTATTCQGVAYSLPWGGTASTAGTYTHTYTTISGCDSVVNIALTVNPTYTVNQTATTCQGVAYSLPWGGTASTAGTYSHTYTTISGCDSVVNITLSIDATFTTNLTAAICQGQSYNLPWGGTASTAGTYSHTYTTISGCDSVVNIALTVNPTYTVNQTATTCQGVPYALPWGGTASTAGTYSHTYTTISGCDSVVNIALTVNPTYTVNQTATTCQGVAYSLPWGGTASTAGTYTHTYTTISGCDSIVNIALTVNLTYTVNQTATTCQGVAYSLPWGGSASTAGTYSHTYTTISGCDSVVNIALTVNPIYTVNQTATTCQGVAYSLPWGGTASTAGIYSHTYTTISGCDSVVNITLSIDATFTTNLTAAICQGQSYNLPWGGTASTAGTYTHTYTTISGCDSVVNIALTVNPTYTVNQTATTCQGVAYSLPWGGTASTAGTYTHTYTTISGCDSVVNIALTVNPTYTVNQTATTCQGVAYSLPWGGTASTAGIYSHTYTTISGCDSIVNIALTVNPTYTVNQTASTCQGVPYTLPWGGTASTAGTYSHTYTTISGCDSVVNITLSIDATFTTNLTAAICQGQSYNLPWGGTASTAGTYTHTYTTISGCDSIVNIALTVNPTYTVNQTATTCQGVAYSLPWGGSASTAGTYTHTYTTISGCDSVVNITLSIDATFTTNLTASICQGQSYNLPWGGTASTAGTYTHTYTTISGCDSVVNIALTVNPTYTVNQTATTCQGVAYSLPWGGTASTAGTYTHTYTTISGCDSIVNIALTVNPTYTVNQTATTCQGVAYSLPWGGSASTAGTYSHTYTTISGCDSVVNITLSIDATFTTNLTAAICQGQSYNLPWGGTASTAGTYTHTYTTISGCDSVVNIALTVNPTYTVNQTATTCQGVPYALPWGGTASTAGIYSHTYTTISGCDSVVNITLSIDATFTTNLTAAICQGQSYNLPWGGTASTAGTYSHTYSTNSGCDSIVNIALTVNQIIPTATTIATCDSYTWNGTSYTQSGDYTYTYPNGSGCNTSDTLHLTINTATTSVETIVACESYDWHGTTYTSSNNSATWTTTNANGCDSVVTLNLTINNGTHTSSSQSACGSYTWNGTTYTQSGDYVNNYTDANGCASSDTLHLTISNGIPTATTIAVCDSYTWNGTTYTQSGDYTYTYPNGSGCNTTDTLHLTINTATTSVETIVACESYDWHGTTYTSSNNTATWTTTNANGCDSVVTLNLTINNGTHTSSSQSACGSYTWNGTTYTQSGDYVNNYTDANGCASSDTLHLTISNGIPTATTIAVCDSYTWNGTTYTQSGDYTYTYPNGSGCNTTDTLHLTINTATTSVETIVACESYDWHGTTYTSSNNTATWTTTNANGCDSLVTLNLTINNGTHTSSSQSACGSYTWNGTTYTQSGDYVNNYTDANGCASSDTLHLTISNGIPTATTIAVCDSYTWNGTTYTQSGDYTYTYPNGSGCNTTDTLHLTINSGTHTASSQSACGSYTWNGTTYTQSGDYVNNYTDANGCASSDTLHLTISNGIPTATTIAVCDSYTWNGTTYTQSGDYTYTYPNGSGCNTTDTLHLTINNGTHTSSSQSACGSYTWNGTTYTQSGDYVNNYTNANGCASSDTLHLTISNGLPTATTIAACDSYTWNGTTYTQSGDYTYTYPNGSGCNTTDTLHLTINNGTHTASSQSACGSYTWNGTTYTQSGDYVNNYTDANGCASSDTLHLTISNGIPTATTIAVCDSYTWNGTTYTQSGDYTYTYPNGSGCNTTDTLHLTINTATTSVETIVACESYDWHGTTYTSSNNSATWTTTNANGCDSVVTLNLTINNGTHTSSSQSACGSYTWNGTTYTQSGDYVNNYTDANGCASSDTLHLTISNGIPTATTIAVCDSYTWNGTTYTQSGDYTYTYPNGSGCNTTDTLHLTINTGTHTASSQSACGSYTWNGTTYTQSGDYVNNYTDANGCASSDTLHLTISNGIPTATTIAVCDSYTWNGTTYTQSGDYTYTYPNGSGCNTTDTLHLTINTATTSVETIVACESYDWHGTTYTSSNNSATWTTTNANGCDSVVTLNLTINNGTHTASSQSACGSYTWNGMTYTQSGDYVNNYTDANGCASSDTLHLTINTATTSVETIVACESYDWHGTTYTSSNNSATWTTTNANGCDSLVTLNLTINNGTHTSSSQSACGSYTWNGTTYTQSGDYVNNYTDANGCASSDTLHLTISNGIPTATTIAVCDSYTWNGTTYTQSGDYTYTYPNGSGCNTTDTLHLTINNGTHTSSSQSACGSYTWNGTTYTQSGDYVNNYTDANGCASSDTLHLTINTATTSVETIVACESYDWHGTTYTSSNNSATWTTTNANGCDSVVTLNLTINNGTHTSSSQSACGSYTWNGTTYTQSGDYVNNYTDANGCASSDTLHLTISNGIPTATTIAVCDSYTWNGTTYTQSGDYTYTYPNGSGCNTTDTLHLTINTATTSVETIVACESYDWHGTTYTSSNNTATWTTTNANGCDSVVTLNLTINNTFTVNTIATICQGSPYNLPWGGTASSSGVYSHTYSTINGCDSTINITLSVMQVDAGPNVSICNGSSTLLNATGGLIYSWSPSSGLTATNISNPVASPNTTTTYYVQSQVRLENLISNGDFSQGNTGFSSSYNYVPYSSPNTTEGQYTVGNIPTNFNPSFLNCTDHTGGSGNMLMINGSPSANTSVYCQTVSVIPNTEYAFSAWLLNLYPVNHAVLQFSINNSLLGATFTSPSNNCDWQEFYATWNSGNNTTAQICIVNQNTLVSGNDFALDDISFSTMCTAVDSVTVTVNPTFNINQTATTCQDVPYALPWGGNALTAGTYSHIYTTTSGCDSVVNIALSIDATFTTNMTVSICQGQIYNLPWGGTANTANTYTHTYNTNSGCDSIVNITLTINPIIPTATTIAACDSYTWNGTTYTQSGDYTYTYPNGSGCNTTDTLHLTINSGTHTASSQSACGSYTWNGTTYTQSGDYVNNYTDANGCASSDTLHLTITAILPQPPVACYETATWNAATCSWDVTGTQPQQPNLLCYQSATWNATTCQWDVTGTQPQQPNLLCYQTATWNATTCQWDVTGTQPQQPSLLCYQTATWNGTTCQWDVMGTQPQQPNLLCYQTATWNATTCQWVITGSAPVPVSSTVTSCSSYSWNGITYNSSGTYQHSYFTSTNCQVTDTLHLTINNGTFTTDTQSACGNYIWNGINYTMSGTYIHPYVSPNGCPSADTLHLTINNGTHTAMNTSACDSYLWHGSNYAQSGTYVYNYNNQWGCNSADTLHLTINPATSSVSDINICSASLPYIWNGQSLTSSGTYTAQLLNSNGCDSIVTLNFAVTSSPPAPQAAAQIGYCQFDPATTLTASGNYPLLWYTTASGGTGQATNPTPITSVPGVQHYYVSQINGNCESPRTHITVRISRKPVLGPDKNLKICYGTGADLTHQYNSIDWQTQWTLNSVPVNNPGNVTTSGSYQIIVTTPAGCSDTALVTISVMPPVVANAGPDANAVYNQPHQLHGSGGGTYTWTPGTGMNNSHIANPTVTLTDDTYFVLTVQDAIGCTDTDTVLIKVFKGPSFYIPNAFTPNGDGLNDDFKPIYVGIERLDYFRIYDRFGVLVYETHNMGAAWNGTYKGRMQNTGNFVYIVKGLDKNGKEKILKGNVLLIH